MQMIHLVDIQQPVESQDSETGAITIDWASVASDIFCDIEPLSVKDLIQSNAHQAKFTVRITLPYLGIDSSGDLNAKMRIIGKCDCHFGKIYNPEGFLGDNQTGQQWITVPCSEGVNEG